MKQQLSRPTKRRLLPPILARLNGYFTAFLALAGVLLTLFAFHIEFESAQAAEQDAPVAFNARIAGDTATTRFFMDFDKRLAVTIFYMDEPYRLVIDLEEVDFRLPGGEGPVARGLVENLQYGIISAGRSRIVLTLNAPAEVIRSALTPLKNSDGYRLLLDFDSTDEQAYAALLDKPTVVLGDEKLAPKESTKPKLEAPKAGKFAIVLDPGHGGIDGGARGSSGIEEKAIVLDFAKRLSKILENNKRYQVLMTRTEDVFVSLSERVAFSREANADLFISIHADSLRQRFVRGATVYTLSKRASDRMAAELADSENSVDLLAGLAAEDDRAAVTDILADLTARETKRFSRGFSNILVRELRDEVLLIKNPQRSAAFSVLRAADVPSVLLELGYLSNEEDEALLQQSQWQDVAAIAIARAVDRFFEGRTPNDS